MYGMCIYVNEEWKKNINKIKQEPVKKKKKRKKSINKNELAKKTKKERKKKKTEKNSFIACDVIEAEKKRMCVDNKKASATDGHCNRIVNFV